MSCICSLHCCLKDAALNAASPILRLTRAGETAWGGLPGDDWTIFSPNHSTYEPLAWAIRNSVEFMSEEISRTPLPTVLQVCVVCFSISLQFCTCAVSLRNTCSYFSTCLSSLERLTRWLADKWDALACGQHWRFFFTWLKYKYCEEKIAKLC